MWPTKGWLSDYLRYTDGHESPTEFHFWNAVAIVGATIQRKMWVDKGYYKVYPNHYVVLVSPPGACRRSVSTNIAMRILRQSQQAFVISEKVTPEGLVATLEQTGVKLESTSRVVVNCTAIIHAPELSVFLGRQQYNEGMIALLTTLYDSPDEWTYITRTKGEITLRNVSLSLLGTTAPDWLAEAIPQIAFGGGFLSRIIFVGREATDRIFPIPAKPDAALGEDLVRRLAGIGQSTGGYRFSERAVPWYDKWYRANRRPAIEDLRLSGYYERKQDHLLRLALVMNAATRADFELRVEDLEQALAVLDYLEPQLPSTFRNIEATPTGRQHQRVLQFIERSGGRVQHSQLLGRLRNWMNARQLKEVEETLQEAGLIGRELDGRKEWWFLIDNGKEDGHGR